MSETVKRGPMARYYTTDKAGVVVRRLGGVDETTDLYAAYSEAVQLGMMVEGFIALSIKGAVVIPNRTMPVGTRKEPGVWLQAIAFVERKNIVKRKRDAGEKVTAADGEAIAAVAMAWARSLTEEEVARARKSKAVKMAHAEITGDDTPLHDLLKAADPVASAVALDEAAD